jgi:amino acid transporter
MESLIHGFLQNPRKTVPAAIKKTFFRILFFYICGVLIVGMVVDSNSPLLAQAANKGTAGGASASPFVVAIQAAGINVLPQIINAWCVAFLRGVGWRFPATLPVLS